MIVTVENFKLKQVIETRQGRIDAQDGPKKCGGGLSNIECEA